MLNFKSIGNGKSVVFLHGFCENLTIWDSYFLEPFSSDFNFISIDLPGHGGSIKYNQVSTMVDIAELVIATLNYLNVKEFILIGHSLGGYVSIEIAKKIEERVKGILFFHSSIFSDSEEKKINRNKVIEFVQENGVDKFVETLIPNLFADENIPLFTLQINHLIRNASKTDKIGLINVVKAMRDRFDSSDWISKVSFPVGFIIGKKDKAVPMDVSIKQVQVPSNSSALLLDNVGHMGMIEDFNHTSKFLKYFITNF